MLCTLCPRACGVDRSKNTGFCGQTDALRVARAALHHWEEPPISGTRGSGTVFFSGCTLGCVFCQNKEISRGGTGKAITPDRLAQIFLELRDAGAHNINLVTPTHFWPQIRIALERVKPQLGIPVVCNCGGYETVETVRSLAGLVDIWLPDCKYVDSALSGRYSAAPDYFEYAAPAIREMHRQQPELVYDEHGILQRGLIVRHLVLPGAWRESIAVLDFLAQFPKGSLLVSLMAQYTPVPGLESCPEIDRRITTFEYNKVLEHLRQLELPGFCQDRRAAKEEYTPPFDLTGV